MAARNAKKKQQKKKQWKARPSRAKRLDPAQRRQKLLQSAIHAFATKGPMVARHRDVALQAHVSLSTVFKYFPTRRGLREAVLADLEHWTLAVARAVHEQGLPAVEALYEHLRRTNDVWDVNPDYARIWLGWIMAIEDDLWSRCLATQGQIIEMIATTIRTGQRDGSIRGHMDPTEGALSLLGAAHMMAQTKAAGWSHEQIERFARHFVDLVFGVSERPGTTES
jgi:TetR/AcrR family hemagglutinin/protease transcriptional regulator